MIAIPLSVFHTNLDGNWPILLYMNTNLYTTKRLDSHIQADKAVLIAKVVHILNSGVWLVANRWQDIK